MLIDSSAYYLIQYIYKNFIDIIKNNALDEIELILSLKWSQLNFILENNFKDKYKLNQDFNKQIIARIKSCTEDDLIHILNILKYIVIQLITLKYCWILFLGHCEHILTPLNCS